MQQSSYIRSRRNAVSDKVFLVEFAYIICQLACSVLIIYFCWYVQAFGNLAIVVNSSFLLMCGCIGVIWFFDGVIHKGIIPYGIWNQLIMVGYSFVIGMLVAAYQSALIESVRHYLIYVVIMISICVVSANKKSYDWVLIMINISAMICCAHLLGWGYHYDGRRIVLSSNNNPNLLGTILNVGLFSVLMRTRISFKSLIFNVPQVCLILYNIIMTGSRKSLIAATMLLVFWAYSAYSHTLKHGSNNQKFFICIVLICAVAAAWYYYTTFVVNTAVMDRMQTMADEQSNNDRIEMYGEAVQIFLDKPFFGGGLEQFGYWSGRGGYSHSTYAEAIADFGFIGSLIYFIPFIAAFVQAFQLSFIRDKTFCSRFVFGFCIVEFFLGVGQIWFFEMSHFFAWTLIFLIIQDRNKNSTDNTIRINGNLSKYVRH